MKPSDEFQARYESFKKRPLVMHVHFPSRDSASAFSRAALLAGLAAAANVREVESMYVWNEDLCERQEWIVDLKTSAASFDALACMASKGHRDQVPAIYTSDIGILTLAYQDWILRHSLPASDEIDPGDPSQTVTVAG